MEWFQDYVCVKYPQWVDNMCTTWLSLCTMFSVFICEENIFGRVLILKNLWNCFCWCFSLNPLVTLLFVSYSAPHSFSSKGDISRKKMFLKVESGSCLWGHWMKLNLNKVEVRSCLYTWKIHAFHTNKRNGMISWSCICYVSLMSLQNVHHMIILIYCI